MSDKSETRPVPQLCKHKASGLAVVRLNGKDHYCGPWGSEQSHSRYHRLVSEWLAAGVPLEEYRQIETVGELVLMYYKHVQIFYQKKGKPTTEVLCQKAAIRFASQLYCDLPVDAFGPLRLKACRQVMIDADLARVTVNANVGRIRQMFRWAAENELIDPTIPERLKCVSGLRKGRGGRETEKINSVPWTNVVMIRDHVAPQIWAMVQLQWLTGMRSGEVTIMRTKDIDTEGSVWLYRPKDNKTEHHDIEKVIAIGPQAQEILRPWLRSNLEDFLFQPKEVICKNKRIRRPRWRPGDHYSSDSYYKAITRAIKDATRPDKMPDDEFKKWKSPLHWFPHQIRHSFADRAKKEFGIDDARAALGHQDVNTTIIYLDRDISQAVKVAKRIG